MGVGLGGERQTLLKLSRPGLEDMFLLAPFDGPDIEVAGV